MSDTINDTVNTGASNEKYSLAVFCEACGGSTHIEVIGVKPYHVCDDVTCMWMKQVQQERVSRNELAQ